MPVDYAEPEGDSIDLALLRVPATERAQGSLVVNPGGPGAPGTDYAAAAGQVFREPLLRAFDIVGFDPRGTGESSPVDCLSDDDLDAYLAGDPDPDDAAEEQQYAADVRAFGAGCAASGEVAGHVTTIEAARDMDVLRAALGESTLTYLGASYGTKLGATYAELFPDRVGRFVLDGAVDVSLDNRQLGLEQAEGFETALRAYVQNCIDTTDECFLGDSVDAGLATIDGLLADIEESPLPTSGDRDLAIGNAFYGIVAPLYNRDYWFILSAALGSALDGNGQALMELADLYSSRGQDGYTDNSTEANVTINCLDDPSSVPFDAGARGLPGLRGGVADLRPDLRLVAHHVQRLHAPLERGAARHPRRGRRPDPRHGYDARPGDAAEVGRGTGRAARVRRAAAPRRRRPHGVQLGQRVRGHRRSRTTSSTATSPPTPPTAEGTGGLISTAARSGVILLALPGRS